MRKTVIGLALAATVLSTPAWARDGSVYAGVEGGVLFPQNMKLDYDVNGNGTIDSTEVNNARFKNKTGWDIDAVVGYDFGKFRLEAEGAYKRAGLSSITSTGFDVDNSVAGVQTSANIAGHVNVTSIMANALIDLGHDSGVNFYAGGGVGYGEAKLRDVIGTSVPYYADSHGGLAWQLIAGLRFPVSSSVDLGLKYRYFNLDKLHYNNYAGVRTDSDFRSHSLMASLLFNFGGPREVAVAPPPPPPPPPAPPPPPPPPPAMRTCPDGTQVLATQACPVPPPPPAVRSGERG